MECRFLAFLLESEIPDICKRYNFLHQPVQMTIGFILFSYAVSHRFPLFPTDDTTDDVTGEF